jgi:UDP-glucose 4-epimerase
MPEAKIALVTGGVGFIGSHLVDRLLSLGYKVVVVDNLTTGKAKNLNPAAAFHHSDITQASVDEVFQRERPNLVFHLAAQVSVAQSTRDPVGDARINLLGTLHLLEVARRYEIEKFIYSSTGGALYGEPETNPCTEEHPIVPLSPYGVSKYQAEQYLELYHRLYRLNYTTLRYGNVYGPRQDPHGEAGVVAIFAQAMLEGMATQIFGDGGQERDFIYVDDVVEANVCAITRGDGQAFNIGTGEGTSVTRIFQALRDIIGYDRAPVYRPPRLGEVYRISLDWGKAARELGWTPRVGLEEGLRRTVEYFRRAAKAAV